MKWVKGKMYGALILCDCKADNAAVLYYPISRKLVIMPQDIFYSDHQIAKFKNVSQEDAEFIIEHLESFPTI